MSYSTVTPPVWQQSAYILVTHGSRDPRPGVAAERLAYLVAERLQALQPSWMAIARSPHDAEINLSRHSALERPNRTPTASSPRVTAPVLVGTATLELGESPLHEQIRQFGDRAMTLGCRHLVIVPLFLLPGVHVREDIPAEVDAARANLHEQLSLHLAPYLGSHPAMVRYLETRLTQEVQQADSLTTTSSARIIMAHGSRRPGGNQPVEAIAAQLNASPAYWFVEPSLEAQVHRLVQAGHWQIAVLPYFLFAGGITDAIAQQVNQLAQELTDVTLALLSPLGASAELSDMVVDSVMQVHDSADS